MAAEPVREIQVLYVEDDPDQLLIFTDQLEAMKRLRATLRYCPGTAEAEELLRRPDHGIDLLVTDNQLPPGDLHGSGSNFLTHLINIDVPIGKLLISSGPPDLLHEQTQKFISEGKIVFLHKQAITPALLEDVLLRILENPAPEGQSPRLRTFSRPVTPYKNFSDASRGLIERLQERYGFGLAMMTRRQGDDWIVLRAADRDYGVKEGDVLNWNDSFCSRMVRGMGPMFTNDKDEVPAYREAPVAGQMPITSYLGIPICREDGTLFGTLCAIDPGQKDESIEEVLPELLIECRYLATILENELQFETLLREKKRAELDSKTDGLTRLYNRRGWDMLVLAEEDRCKRYGHNGSVILIDLDGLKAVNDRHGHEAGDKLIRRAAEALSLAVRGEDVVARLGGDEFAVLAIETDEAAAQMLMGRLRQALDAARVQASMGVAGRHAGGSFEAAIQQADQRMYEEKRLRRN